MKTIQDLDPERFSGKDILLQLNRATRVLAELKGVAGRLPNQGLLINTLPLQESKDSSAIENIVTTQDEIYQQDNFPELAITAAAKEVARYRDALSIGFESLKKSGLLTVNDLVRIQATLMGNQAGIRTQAGTVLKDQFGEIVYKPPQESAVILEQLAALEKVVNDPEVFAVDPLIRMALIHYQFEAIHPFYDGNGRTGRILNVLFLVKEGLLDIPVLYLSRAILRTRAQYYESLDAVHRNDAYEPWVAYMLGMVEESARDALDTILRIERLFRTTKERIRSRHSFYSQDLINHLFMHPYTRVEPVQEALGNIHRTTATKYLKALVADGILEVHRKGRTNYYIHTDLWEILKDPPTDKPRG